MKAYHYRYMTSLPLRKKGNGNDIFVTVMTRNGNDDTTLDSILCECIGVHNILDDIGVYRINNRVY